jgi:ribulose-5-phosphate 4-epimerase/fuculose-1-phosphate aldolase
MAQGDQERDPRLLVSIAGLVLAAHGHDDYIWGHVALRDADGRGFWMKSAGYGFNEVGPDRVLLYGLDGRVLEGDGRAHVEWPIHASIFAARPEVNATVHTHPPHALTLAATGSPLRPVSQAATLFAPPDLPRFTHTANLIDSPELGKQLAAELGDASAILLVNHGILTVASELEGAVGRAVLLEDACRQQIMVDAAGGAQHWVSDAEAVTLRSVSWSPSAMRQLWDYLVRSLPAAS